MIGHKKPLITGAMVEAFRSHAAPPNGRAKPPETERGFALLLVVWMLAILALIAHLVGSSGRMEARMAGVAVHQAQLEAAADGAAYDGLWRAATAGSAEWQADGRVHRLLIGGIPTDVAVENEAGKIDLNVAPPALLAALIAALGEPAARAQALASEIVAWRTPQSDIALRAAADQRYHAARLAWTPAFAPFANPDDLRAVIGMPPELADRLSPHVTCLTKAAPDPASASLFVKAVLARANIPSPPTAKPDATKPAAAVKRLFRVTATAHSGEAGFQRRLVAELGAKNDLRLVQWQAVGRGS